MLGYDHDSFWKQTPRTLSLTYEAATERLTREHNERAWVAWHVAGLMRAKTMPPLRSLQARMPQQQSMQEQIDGLRRFVAATGGKVVYQPKDQTNG